MRKFPLVHQKLTTNKASHIELCGEGTKCAPLKSKYLGLSENGGACDGGLILTSFLDHQIDPGCPICPSSTPYVGFRALKWRWPSAWAAGAVLGTWSSPLAPDGSAGLAYPTPPLVAVPFTACNLWRSPRYPSKTAAHTTPHCCPRHCSMMADHVFRWPRSSALLNARFCDIAVFFKGFLDILLLNFFAHSPPSKISRSFFCFS